MAKSAARNRSEQKPARVRGRFGPGESGNLAGRPPVDKQLTEVIRQKWPAERLEREMAKLARSKNLELRMRALCWLADRGHGKVKETIDMKVTGEVNHKHAHVHLALMNETHVERKRRLEELRQKAAAALPAPAAEPVPVDDDADPR